MPFLDKKISIKSETLIFLAGDRILKKLLSGLTEKQKNTVISRMRSVVNKESGSSLLRRSVDNCMIFIYFLLTCIALLFYFSLLIKAQFQ